MRTVPYGESDLIVTFLTESDGTLGARLRGGRKSSKRAAGGIEPFHTLEVTLDDRGGDLLTLKENRFVTVRAGLVRNLDAMDAGGAALRWARHLLPTRHPEPAAWATLVRLLDALDTLAGDEEATPSRPDAPGARGLLALAGMHLLASVGYALDLDRCIVCERPCPRGATAFVDATRGGIVCTACGGGGRRIDGRVRDLAAKAQRARGSEPAPPEETSIAGWITVPRWMTRSHADDLLALLTDAMAVHTGLDPSK